MADDEHNEWLKKAKSAYEQSTAFIDNNYRKQWEDGIRHFQSRFATGSKYYKAAYKYRSRVFRSKTRALIRSNEAAAVAAFFANKDVVSMEPQNYDDPFQRASAEIMQALLNYRLTETIPWFLTLIGGYQDSMKVGVVCSYQAWEYKEKTETIEQPVIDPETGLMLVDGETGEPLTEKLKVTIPISDQPFIELTPIENIRFHPAASWIDPINTSPYLIRLIPKYVLDVKARMKEGDEKTGQPKWIHLEDDDIKSATRVQYDSTRQTREGDARNDPKDEEGPPELSDFDVVWVHENFVRQDNEDYVYYTLGTTHILSDPVPIEEIYFTGERPVTLGFCIVESHKNMPEGHSGLAKHLQEELNENVNQRLDNVKLVMNKRWFVRRGAQVDVKSIVRNVPASVTMINSKGGKISDDIMGHEFHDVTGSSYAEQDRLGLDFDELAGMFSPSTIQSNRRMNETVGGMTMLRGSANSLSEYSLRTLAETWVEPTLRQLVKLEQKYETDEVILALAAQKAQLFQKYGIDRVTDDLLNQQLTVSVNVGMGATDPLTKLQNFIMAIKTIIEVFASSPPGTLNVLEVASEIFGYVGYKSGARFFVQQMGGQDPEKMQMAQIIEQLQMTLQQLEAELKSKREDNQTKLIETNIKERGEDRRKAADIAGKLKMKEMDLMNPVVGEEIRH